MKINKKTLNYVGICLGSIVILVVFISIFSADNYTPKEVTPRHVEPVTIDGFVDGNGEASHSWLYGKWELAISGERQVITFSPHGTYGSVFQSPTWGTSTEYGRYEIKGNTIYLYDSADERHPSIIDVEGERLKSDSHYYRKIN